MAIHERQTIREAVVAALSGNTSAGTRVSKSRLAPNDAAQLPAINVYTDVEAVDPVSHESAPRTLRRAVSITIDAWVAADVNLDDALDAISLEIEAAMDTDVWLAGAARDSYLTASEIGMTRDGARPMGVVQLKYDVEYRTTPRIAAVVDAFVTADVRFPKLNGTTTINTTNQAHDTVHPEQ